ncbi:AMP-binding protein, partial [Bordetella hinzii]
MIALGSSILHWARSAPARTAMVYDGQAVSYGELAQRMRLIAGGLRARGIGAGQVVALLMKNSAAFVELSLAIGHLGAIVLPINYRLGRDEVDYILCNAGARLLCADAEFEANVPPGVDCLRLDGPAQRDASRLWPRALPAREPWPVGPGDVFRLMYTSGTTDRPKGVVHSYENFYWKTLDHICELGLSREDRLLVVGPLYHVGAFDLPGMALFLVGGSLVILRDFDASTVMRTIAAHRLTGAWMAPVMLNRLLALPAGHDVSSLRWVIGGGERTPAERIRGFQALFPNARYIDAYGLTETCSGDTMMQAGREIEKIGSAGR